MLQINLNKGQAYTQIWFLTFIPSLSNPIIQDPPQSSLPLWNNIITLGEIK